MQHWKKVTATIVGVIALTTGLSACNGDQPTAPSAQDQAVHNAESRANYVPKNDVEGKNYNARMEIADNPATILWCTAFPTNPNAAPITVPITGKLTSGNKRPYPTTQDKVYGDGFSHTFSPELPGSDGMFGSSGEYRYGFRPDGVYEDFYNMETICSTEPTIYQKQKTFIDLGSDASSNSLSQKAVDALKKCRAVDPDPSKPCTAAQAALASIAGMNK